MAKNMSFGDEVKIKEAIFIVLGMTLLVLVIYFLTVGAQKLGFFDERYVKPQVSTAVISYENILAGSVFNRTEEEYFVIFADFSGNDAIYLSGLGANYKAKKEGINLYSVDLGNDMNKYILSEDSNTVAQSSSDLKVKGHTLIRIKNGSNIQYVEGDENIKSALGL